MFEYNLFKKLPTWIQVEVLQRQGSFLAQRQHKDWTVRLFSLDYSFYEVWQQDGLELVTNFKPSSPPLEILEPYLAAVQVPLGE
ncbi:MAG: hypothetical protein ACO1OQ_01335 [Rufibacter sp.]